MKKGGPKSENRAAFKVLARFSRFPGTPKNMPNGSQMEPKIDKQIIKSSENWAMEKTCKNRLPTSRQKCHDSAKWGLIIITDQDIFFMKFEEVAKMPLLGVPGSKRQPKGIQKASKRAPESLKMTSKRRPQGIRIR